jgi:hypothetical protein
MSPLKSFKESVEKAGNEFLEFYNLKLPTIKCEYCGKGLPTKVEDHGFTRSLYATGTCDCREAGESREKQQKFLQSEKFRKFMEDS